MTLVKKHSQYQEIRKEGCLYGFFIIQGPHIPEADSQKDFLLKDLLSPVPLSQTERDLLYLRSLCC